METFDQIMDRFAIAIKRVTDEKGKYVARGRKVYRKDEAK